MLFKGKCFLVWAQRGKGGLGRLEEGILILPTWLLPSCPVLRFLRAHLAQAGEASLVFFPFLFSSLFLSIVSFHLSPSPFILFLLSWALFLSSCPNYCPCSLCCETRCQLSHVWMSVPSPRAQDLKFIVQYVNPGPWTPKISHR